ncbi:RNA polymerase-associated protein LEO1 family protein [Babesia bovis T2Bo]|uniref:Uncharacterized protein n=1 Tax=Babesia bovis TaxID=5865 RepID=A7AN98_BABBO|nr:RNA polymerase-associated protein LEO1 family protein [Babesia bovis T2Bo]EDO08032.1 RNA polymerase-associated protein LEO1 family protein [Babesia bovis T2Bo]|eukprot:XP_001611600.1 hypothetical protein [Babesia bovis T2Bo]
MDNDDIFEHGLFEDSEVSSADGELESHLTTVDLPNPEEAVTEVPSSFISNDIQRDPEPSPESLSVTYKSIPRSACPVRDHHLIICKFPPAVSMAGSPFNEIQERQALLHNPKLLDDLSALEDSVMMRWRFKCPSSDSPEPFGVLETNTHFVEWDDGSFTLFVGDTPLNVDYRSETVFLLEDSCSDVKPIHAVITERMQTKFSNIFKNKFTRSKDLVAKRQRMALTSIADAVSSNISVQKYRLATKENERYRRIQQSVAYKPRTLTRSFLESDSDSQ